MRYTAATLFMTVVFAVGLNSTFSQSIVVVEVDVSSQPNMLRVAGNTGVGYVDRIVEIPSDTQTDTVLLEIFHDFCALPGAFQVYDTTFAMQSSFPFDLCVTVFKDTLTQESPCDNWSLTIDTGQTVCLTADQILSAERLLNRSQVKLFPNPASGNLNIDLTAFQKIPSSYIIRDLSGRLLKEGALSEIVETVDVSELPSGILILEMQFESGVLRQRFVKL